MSFSANQIEVLQMYFDRCSIPFFFCVFHGCFPSSTKGASEDGFVTTDDLNALVRLLGETMDKEQLKEAVFILDPEDMGYFSFMVCFKPSFFTAFHCHFFPFFLLLRNSGIGGFPIGDQAIYRFILPFLPPQLPLKLKESNKHGCVCVSVSFLIHSLLSFSFSLSCI